MRAELEILGLDVSRHVVDTYAASSTRSGSPAARDLLAPAQQGRAAGGRGQGRHPDPADPVRAPGGLPDPRRRDRPGRRDLLRGRPGPLRRHRLPLLAAGRARRAAPHRPARRLAAGDRLLGAARAVRALARRRAWPRSARRWPSVPEGFAGVGRGGRRRRGREPLHPAGGVPARRRASPPRHSAAGGMGRRRVLVHSSGFRLSPVRRHQAGRRGRRQGRRRASCGTAARGARDEPAARSAHATRVAACQPASRPSERRSSRPHRRGVGGPAPGPATTAGSRDVLDIGGGTGGFAVRVAELGHRVPVVDPSPDALASLDRRAREAASRRSPASRATSPACSTSSAPAAPTWCSATACSRSSTTPPRRCATIRRGAASRRHAQPAGRPAARRRGGPGDGRPLPAGPGAARRPAAAPGRGRAPLHRRGARPRCWPAPASSAPRCTGSGSSPTWCPARCSTSSPVPPRPWSSSSAPSPSGPSTSRWPRSCTLLAALTRVPAHGGGRDREADPSSACPILHVDMDAFYASVATRDRPDLRDVPVIVGGGHRGVVLSANYLARRVRRALGDADDPGPAAVPAGGGDRARLRAVRHGLRLGDGELPPGHPAGRGALARRGVPRRPRLGPAARARPREIAEQLRATIHDEQGITCSVGVAASVSVAKLASRRAKPDGVVVVPPEAITSFLHPLDVGRAVGGGGEDPGDAAPARPGHRRRRRPHPAAHPPARGGRRPRQPPPRAGLGHRPAGDHPAPRPSEEPDQSMGADETFGRDTDDRDVIAARAAAALGQGDRPDAGRRGGRPHRDDQGPVRRLHHDHPVRAPCRRPPT